MQNTFRTRFGLAALALSAGLGLLVALLVSLPGALAQGSSQVQFAPAFTTIGTPGNSVYDIAVADLDDDGDQDMVAAVFGIELWRNEGNGTWISRTLFGSGHTKLALGDLDNDGDIDIVSQNASSVYVLENDGTPWNDSWPRMAIGQVSSLCTDLALADFDLDGYLDLVTADLSGPIQVWRNDGTPFGNGWTPTLVGSVSGPLLTLTVGDLDNDGDIDIASGNQPGGMGGLTLWQNDGTPFDGAWVGNSSTSFGSQPLDMVAGDLDRDGALDIVVYSGSAVHACQNDHTPFTETWSCATVSQVSASGFRVAFGDADQDGDLDIFAESGGNPHVWTNDGTPFSGSWSGAALGTLGGSVEAIAVSDLDGDGDLDVAAGNRYSEPRILAIWDNILVHRSRQGYLPFDGPTTVISGTMDYAYAVTTADLDNDGDLDYVLGQYNGLLLVRSEDGATRSLGASTDAIYAVVAADVDRDGDLDLIIGRDVTSNNVQIWVNPLDGGSDIWGSTPWSRATVGTANGGVFDIAVGDLNRDGFLDIASASDASTENVQVWQHDGYPITGTWSANTVFTATERAASLALGDLDHDGYADLAVGSSSSYEGYLYTCQNDGSPFTDTWTCNYVGSVEGSVVTSIVMADLDNDGRLDLVSGSHLVSGGGSPNLHVWRNDGSPFTDTWSSLGIAETLDDLFSIAVADLDADGDPDVVGAGIGTGNMTAWCSDGTPFDAASWAPFALDTGVNHFGRVVTIADVNNDGRADVIGGSYNEESPAAYDLRIWRNAGAPVTVVVTDTAPAIVNPNAVDDLLQVTITHNGVIGDSDIEPAWWDVQLTAGDNTPLTTAQAQALLASLHVYRETGVTPGFQRIEDTEVLSLAHTAFALSGGVQRLTFPDGHALAQIGADETATYYLVVTMRSAGQPLAPATFRAVLDPDDGVRVENATVDANLLVQTADAVQSGIVSVQNHTPTLNGISAEPEWVRQGGVITATSSGASDPDGDPLALRCGTTPGGSDLGAGSYGPGERTLAFGAPWTDDDLHTIWCVVTDGDLGSAEFSATVTADNTLPAVSLISPQGGEAWQSGLEYAVSWSASDAHLSAYPIALSYSLNDGSTWTAIASGIANSGAYSWTPPITSTAQARVRVQAIDQAGNVGLAVSAAFTLTKSQEWVVYLPVVIKQSP